MTQYLTEAPLTTLVEVLRSRDVSSRELTTAFLQRIGERNGGAPSFDGDLSRINAWSHLYPERALADADRADRARSSLGENAPPLCGVPLGLKNMIGVKGLARTASSRALDNELATEDSVAWTRLHQDFAVLIGHTHSHEFALGGTTDQVGNALNTRYSAGGSSGGSAAAVASGMVPAALGTDTGGSVRIPASFSGITAIKPTVGLVPLGGVLPMAWSLDHVGPMARNAADCLLLLESLSPSVASDWRPPAGATESLPLAGVRVGMTSRIDRTEVHPDVRLGVSAAAAFFEQLGAELVELPDTPPDAGANFARILMSELHFVHQPYASRRADYREGTRRIIEQCDALATWPQYMQAIEEKGRIAAAWELYLTHNRIDVMLEPTTAMSRQERTLGYATDTSIGTADPLAALALLWNFTGHPVVSLPSPTVPAADGFPPPSVSLVGRLGSDARIARIAQVLQESS